jgi:hypothetical protein
LKLYTSLSDDGQKSIATGGVRERLTSSASEKHPCAKPSQTPNLNLNPDIKELLDRLKSKSAPEASSALWCGSAADIDALKEVLVSGSVAEIRATRNALIHLDELRTLCPVNPVTSLEEQTEAYAKCQGRFLDQRTAAFGALQDKMKSLVPGARRLIPRETRWFSSSTWFLF